MFDLIILDLDGTLYDLNDVLASVYNYQVDFIKEKTGKTRHEAIDFLTQHNIFPQNNKESHSATEFFLSMGIHAEEWKEFREHHFDETIINKEKAVKCDIIKSLARYSRLLLLSSNTIQTINKIANWIQIDLKIFDCIYCSDCNPFCEHFNKYEVMAGISKKYDVSPNRMLSIGDRFETDIKPMLKLGGKGILLTSPKSLIQVRDDLASGHFSTSDKYFFFEV